MPAFLLPAMAFAKKVPGWVWGVVGGILALLFLRARWMHEGGEKIKGKVDRKAMKEKAKVDERITEATETVSEELDNEVEQANRAYERVRVTDRPSELPERYTSILYRNRGGGGVSG